MKGPRGAAVSSVTWILYFRIVVPKVFDSKEHVECSADLFEVVRPTCLLQTVDMLFQLNV